MKTFFFFSFLLSTVLFGFADSTIVSSNLTKHFLLKEGTDSVKAGYLMYLPEGYNKSKENYPLILFLHGGGERGNDPDLLRRHGLTKLIDKGKKIPFIVVSPQCPSRQYWNLEVLNDLVNFISKNYNVDTMRIYLTGLSMGGIGTWGLAMLHPEKFAAIAPLCGFGDTTRAAVLKNMPIWAFHGAKDTIVPVQRTEELVRAITREGGNVKFTRYNELGHSIWRETYNNPDLYDWLLEQKRNKAMIGHK